MGTVPSAPNDVGTFTEGGRHSSALGVSQPPPPTPPLGSVFLEESQSQANLLAGL